MGNAENTDRDEGDEGDEGDDEGRRGAAVEGRDRERARGFVGCEEEGGEGCDGGAGCGRPGGAEVGREVCSPRDHDDQATEEARDQGREADGLWEGGLREGEARTDLGEVLRREGAEGQFLSCLVPGFFVAGRRRRRHGAFAPGCGVISQSVRAMDAPHSEPDGTEQSTSLYTSMWPKS